MLLFKSEHFGMVWWQCMTRLSVNSILDTNDFSKKFFEKKKKKKTHAAGFSSSSWGEQLWTKAATEDTWLPQGTRSSLVFSSGTTHLLVVVSYCISACVCLFIIFHGFQVQFSLLSMGGDQMEIKSICDSLGIRLISYSPLGLGMLTGKYTPTCNNLPRGPR